jgi:hypothetical protein
MVPLGSPGNNCYKKGYLYVILTWNHNSNSYFQGNLGELYFIERIFTGSIFFQQLLPNEIWFP